MTENNISNDYSILRAPFVVKAKQSDLKSLRNFEGYSVIIKNCYNCNSTH